MKFPYSLNTSTIKPTPLMDKIRIAGEVGYDMVELWCDDLSNHVQTGGSLADVKKALDDQGLQVPTVIALFNWVDTAGAAFDRALEEVRRRMNLAAEIGAQRIVASPCMGKANLDVGAANYKRILELGRETGVMPAMEFLGFVDAINTIEAAWYIIENAQDADGTIVLDPFHIYRGAGPWETVKTLPAARIAVCHFNDTPAQPPRDDQTDAHRVFPGDGHLPLQPFVRDLIAMGYRGPISLELFNRDYWAQDPTEVARIGLEKMRHVVETA